MGFSKDFIWGAASSSYQIEGGAFEAGKGLSIWDQFSHIPGKVKYNETGDVAADAWNHFEEDLDLMQKTGIRHYRFSISWPRLFPDGKRGLWTPPGDPAGLNRDGLAYYDRLIDGCLTRGITPWVTLYHWDLPLALQHEGGWQNKNTACCFADYAAFFAAHFKGRVRHYITINEPQCIIGLGLSTGEHAPGYHLDPEESFLAWHNLLLAHGLAVTAIKKQVPDAIIGVASTGALTYPVKPAPDLAQASSGSFPVPATMQTSDPVPVPECGDTPAGLVNGAFRSLPPSKNSGWIFNHQWFLDPLIYGKYPDDPDNPWQPFTSGISKADLEMIATPIDFIGLNIYNGSGMLPSGKDGCPDYLFVEKYPGFPRTAMKWPVTPDVMYWGPRLIWERYGKPMYITENGQSCNDRIFLDGNVHDPDRIDFLHRYLRELKKACTENIPVLGYFHWAFTDNFEWNNGYDERFGLIYIDYRTQQRIPKDSAFWYQKVIESNGMSL